MPLSPALIHREPGSRKYIPSPFYYALVALVFILLVYIAMTLIPRGDESGLYLPAFKQAFATWPRLDLSPYWPVSSFYLWIVASIQTLAGNQPTLIQTGRLLSLVCWIVVVLRLLATGYRTGLLVLFNPYVLIYAIRAHPFVPSILLFYGFWTLTRRNQRMGWLLLPWAVNFQVFMAGAVGLFTPEWPLRRGEMLRALLVGLLVVVGVLLTFLTWGGIYPENFTKHHFYRTFQEHGNPTFSYIWSVPMLAGLVFWVAGCRTVTQMKENARYSLVVLVVTAMGGLFLALSTDMTGITHDVMRRAGQPGWVGLYCLAGLGWLRLHRSHYLVFCGLLASGLTLVSLHYFYERLTVFALIAPCLAWCCTGETEADDGSILLVCGLCLAGSIAYQFHGSL